MFSKIILLSGLAEGTVLTQVLQRHNPHLSVRPVDSLAELETLTRTELRRARLVSFVTPVIVPARILDALGFGAYNFHPGPPHYPGWLPSIFAIYDRAALFGVTAHRMTEQVDAGPIVGVELFEVPPNATPHVLEQRAFTELVRLFWRLSKTLATQIEPLDELPVTWTGRKSTQRLFADACEIPHDIERAELERRLAAFGGGAFGLVPTVTLHGHRFRYEPPPEGLAEAPPPAAAVAKQAVA